MGEYYTEQRILKSGKSLSWDIAHHLYVRQFRGVAIILTDRPAVLLPAVRKQWQKIARQAQRERSRTLKPEKVKALNKGMEHMEQLRFSAKIPAKADGADVLFITAHQLLKDPLFCHTLYVTSAVGEEILENLTSTVRRHGVVVAYF